MGALAAEMACTDPRTNKRGGGMSMRRNRFGYDGSSIVTTARQIPAERENPLHAVRAFQPAHRTPAHRVTPADLADHGEPGVRRQEQIRELEGARLKLQPGRERQQR